MDLINFSYNNILIWALHHHNNQLSKFQYKFRDNNHRIIAKLIQIIHQIINPKLQLRLPLNNKWLYQEPVKIPNLLKNTKLCIETIANPNK